MTLWYPRYMLQYRIAMFEGGATLAGERTCYYFKAIVSASVLRGVLGSICIWYLVHVRDCGPVGMVMDLRKCSTAVSLCRAPAHKSKILEGILTVIVALAAFFSVAHFIVHALLLTLRLPNQSSSTSRTPQVSSLGKSVRSSFGKRVSCHAMFRQ